MKKFALSFLSVAIAVCAVTGFAGCSTKTEHNHEFVNQKAEQEYLAKEATCTNAAEYYYSCECGEKGTTTFAFGEPKEHEVAVDQAVEATCTETGLTEGKHCSVCNAVIVKQEVIPAKGHTEVIDQGVAATRTDDGLTEGKHCSVCGTVLAERQVIRATGSLGLKYDGNTVAGTGTCIDADIIIPKYSPEGNLVTKIGANAFSGSAATSIDIPDTIEEIGSRAFSDCADITEIHIPSSVTEIGERIFHNASSLVTVYYDSSYAPSYRDRNNSFLKESSIKKVVFGGACVPSYIMYSCENITETVISDSVTDIGNYAFYWCSGIASVTLGNGITSIEDDAFSHCVNLESIVIPAGVTSIGTSAFLECYSLENIYISDLSAWCKVDGLAELMVPGLENKNLYLDNRLITDLIIPAGVTNIGRYAFFGCSRITSVTVSNGVTSIGDSAFGVCSGLTSITIPNSVTNIGEYSFRACSGLTEIIIPNGVTGIGEYAFAGCDNLTSITLPDSLKVVGNGWFNACVGLTSITLPDSVTSIGYAAFFGCSGLASVTIPVSVVSIAESAFWGCGSLTSVKYDGTMQQWKTIRKDSWWNKDAADELTIVCSDGVISK